MQRIKIDIDKVLKSKSPRLYRWMPSFAVSYIKKIVHQNEINNFLEKAGDIKNRDFIDLFLKDIDVKYEVEGSGNLSDIKRATFVSNHPLGGLDGMILLHYLSSQYENVKVIVNDLLMYIPNLVDMFVPVNKLGAQNKENAALLDSNMKSDTPILFFPAGKVSRQNAKGIVEDLEWKRTFLRKSREYQRDIVPIYFNGKNSKFFYRLAKYREKLSLPNIEMLFLPDEMFNAKGRNFKITIGERIPHSVLANQDDRVLMKQIREAVYSMKRE